MLSVKESMPHFTRILCLLLSYISCAGLNCYRTTNIFFMTSKVKFGLFFSEQKIITEKAQNGSKLLLFYTSIFMYIFSNTSKFCLDD